MFHIAWGKVFEIVSFCPLFADQVEYNQDKCGTTEDEDVGVGSSSQ